MADAPTTALPPPTQAAALPPPTQAAALPPPTQVAPPDAPVGHPVPWQLWHQEPATPVMERLEDFHLMLLVVTVGICALVGALLAWVVFRYRERRNPTPSTTSHNTLLEVAWTTIPVLILVAIAIPSFRNLYDMDRLPAQADMTLKVIGRQWYWDFAYPDQGGFTVTSIMIPPEDLPPGGKRLLEVDTRALVPVGATVELLVTSEDVLHAMAMPSLGIKRDAVPGRLNQTWMRIDRPGVYYGQCSEICGTGHAFMPMAIEAVPADVFARWVTERQAEAGLPTAAATASRTLPRHATAPAAEAGR